MRISDWSSDVCSSDLGQGRWHAHGGVRGRGAGSVEAPRLGLTAPVIFAGAHSGATGFTGRGRARVRSYTLLKPRSEEHTSELQSLMRISYAVFCLTKKTHNRSF